MKEVSPLPMDEYNAISKFLNGLIMKSKSSFLRLKDNLNIILLVPTLIGGLWQLLELASLSPAYIRFFSLSQIVPDGLLILFVLSILFISYKFGIFLHTRRFKNEIEGQRPPSIVNAIILLALTISAAIFIGIKISDTFASSNATLTLISAVILCVIFILGLMLLAILRIIRFLAFKYEDKITTFTEDEHRQKTLINRISSMISYIAIPTFIILVYFALFVLPPLFKASRDSLLIPDDLINRKNTEQKIQCDFGENIDWRLRYYNDKHLFFELYPNTDTTKIYVIEFSNLFKKVDCK